MPVLRVDADLRSIAEDILRQSRTATEWAQVESDDMFARGPYVGGYDADEHAFCFGYTGADEELWFQFALDEAQEIAAGQRQTLPARKPPA